MNEFPIEQKWLDSSVGLWFSCGGDNVLGLDFDHLDSDSVVMEVGGYHGLWTKNILDKYNCTVYMYEPVVSCYEKCIEAIGFYEKAHLLDYGLSDKTEEVSIYLDGDGSSMTKTNDKKSIINVVDVLQEMEEIGGHIDLMHLNIEGAEYDLLDHILKNGDMTRIKTILVQFHYHEGRTAYFKRQDIQRRLADTHNIVFNFEFVWERWDLRKG